MKHFYSEDSQGVVVTFNDVAEFNGVDVIPFYIEQTVEGRDEPFNYAQGKLPYFTFEKAFGFSDDQLMVLMDYIKRNSCLIYDIAREETSIK
jgi:hypothetical protein